MTTADGHRLPGPPGPVGRGARLRVPRRGRAGDVLRAARSGDFDRPRRRRWLARPRDLRGARAGPRHRPRQRALLPPDRAWAPAALRPPRPRRDRLAPVAPEVALDEVAVALVPRAEGQQGEALVAGREGARDGRRDADGVQGPDVDDLVVELEAAVARDHHVDLLRVLVAVREALAPARLDDVVGEPDRLAAEGLAREARLLRLAEAELGRGVLDLAQVLHRVAAHQPNSGGRLRRARASMPRWIAALTSSYFCAT